MTNIANLSRQLVSLDQALDLGIGLPWQRWARELDSGSYSDAKTLNNLADYLPKGDQMGDALADSLRLYAMEKQISGGC